MLSSKPIANGRQNQLDQNGYCRCATSRICWPSAVSTLATRPFDSGGTGLARCSPPRFVSDASRTCAAIRSGRWHLDEVFVKINGKLCYLWRAVDHEGEVLEAVVTARRDKAAAIKLLKRIMKKYGPPHTYATGDKPWRGVVTSTWIGAARGLEGPLTSGRGGGSPRPERFVS